MKSMLSRLAAVIVLSITASGALADLQSELDNMMNSLTDTSGGVLGNATAPGVYKSATRGIASGGAIQIRTAVKSGNIWNITPPSIRAGCSGIDLYGGAISLISKEEFINMLRAIGQNAVGYAFQLALETQCPLCSDVMSWLGDKINDYGMMDLSSCRSAQYLVDSLASKNGRSIEKMGSDISEWLGGSQDKNEASSQQDGTTPLQKAKAADPNWVKTRMHGNLLWRVLHKANTQSVFAGGDEELMRAFLSMFGTIVVKEENTETGDGSSSDPKPWPALMDAEDLFAGTGGGSDEREIYTCPDGEGEDECLEDGKGPYRIKGMKTRVLEMLVGTDGVSGIVGKFASDNAALNAQEQSFIAVIGAVGARLERITRISHDLGRKFAEEVAERLAVEYVDLLVGRATFHIKNIVPMIEHPSAKDLEELVEDRSIALRESVRKLRAAHPSTLSDILSVADRYEQERLNAPNVVSDSPAHPN